MFQTRAKCNVNLVAAGLRPHSIRNGWMVDELDQQAIGVPKVKGPGAVAMCLRFLHENNPKVPEAVRPEIDILG